MTTNYGRNNYVRFIKRKIIALLHDPPTKPWNIVHHEKHANELISSLFPDLDERWKDKITYEDMLAATFDRQLLSPFYEFNRRDLIEERDDYKRVFKNIFYPCKEEDVSFRPSDAYKIYKNIISKIILIKEELVGNEDLDKYINVLYHLLFHYLEPLWIIYGGVPPVADTRTPHHTVFDHNVAVASVVNWVNNGEFSGYFIRIDVKGIHDFISRSRKVRDLWISSYLVTLIIWNALKPFVISLGPDIVLSPSLRFNPIYHATLDGFISRVSNKSLENLFNEAKLSSLFTNLYGFDINQNNPAYAIQPAIMTLALPDIELIKQALKEIIRSYSDLFGDNVLQVIKEWIEDEVEDVSSVRRLLSDLISASWRDVVYTVLRSYENKFMEGGGCCEDQLFGGDQNLFKEFKDIIERFSLDQTPPFVTQIGVASLREASKVINVFKHRFKEIDNKIRNKSGKQEFEINEKHLNMLFRVHILDILNRLVDEDIKANYSLKRTPYGTSKITEVTEDIFIKCRKNDISELKFIHVQQANGEKIEAKRFSPTVISGSVFKYCTSCGELPAIYIVDRDYEGDPFKKGGEKLCPICLFKRLASQPEVVDELSNHIFCRNKTVDFSVPSVSDISTLPFRDYLLRHRVDLDQDIKHIFSDLRNGGYKLSSYYFYRVDLGRLRNILPSGYINENLELIEKVRNEIENEDKDHYSIIFFDAEHRGMFLNNRGLWKKLVSNISDKWLKPWIYYVLIYTDGDRMGKLISGDLYGARIFPKTKCGLEFNEAEECVNFYLNYISNSINWDAISEEGSRLINEVLSELKKSLPRLFTKLMSEKSAGDKLLFIISIDDYISLLHDVFSELKAKSINLNSLTKSIIILILSIFIKPYVGDGHSKEYRLLFRPSISSSPAYYTTISRSLIISVLNDIKKVINEWGIVILAGGDDLLAILPIGKIVTSNGGSKLEFTSLSVAREIREFYSSSFINIGQSGINDRYKISMLYGMGRSCVYSVAHYRDPLYMVVNYVESLLKGVAKESSVWKVKNKSECYSRDGLLFTFISRGSLNYVLLPNYIYKNSTSPENKCPDYNEIREVVIGYIEKIMCNIRDGNMSSSLITDVLKDPVLSKYGSLPSNLVLDDVLKELLENIILRNRVEDAGKNYAVNRFIQEFCSIIDISPSYYGPNREANPQHIIWRMFMASKNIFSGMRW